MKVPITPADTYRDVQHFIDHWTKDLPADVALKMVRSYCKHMAEPDRYVPMTEEDVAAYRDMIRGWPS